MYKGDLYVVKKAINHRVSSEKECLIMLIESKTTEHIGKSYLQLLNHLKNNYNLI